MDKEKIAKLKEISDLMDIVQKAYTQGLITGEVWTLLVDSLKKEAEEIFKEKTEEVEAEIEEESSSLTS